MLDVTKTIPLARLSDCQGEHDPIGQALAAVTSAVANLKDLVILENRDRAANLDRMANQIDFDIICHDLARLQLVASSIEVRMIANAAVGK